MTPTAKSSPPPFLNGIWHPRRNHSSLQELWLTSPRYTIQAYNIGFKRQHQQNNQASELVPACSPPYLTLYLQFFWTMPGLLPTGLTCCCILSLTLTPPPEKTSFSRYQTSLALKWEWGKQHRFYIPCLRCIPTSKRGIVGTNNSPLYHWNPGPRPQSQSQDQVTKWLSRTGQLWPPRTQRVTSERINKTTIGGTSITDTVSHRKPGVWIPSPVPSKILTPTFPHPFRQSFLPDRLPTIKGVPWKCIANMIWHGKSWSGCYFNNPDNSPCLKFHQ